MIQILSNEDLNKSLAQERKLASNGSLRIQLALKLKELFDNIFSWQDKLPENSSNVPYWLNQLYKDYHRILEFEFSTEAQKNEALRLLGSKVIRQIQDKIGKTNSHELSTMYLVQ